MATFTERIIEYTGAIPGDFDTNEALYEGVLDVIEKIKAYYPNEIFKYAQKVVMEPGGTDILDTGEPVHVTRDSIECVNISPSRALAAQDFNSLYYRTKENPSWYVDAGLLHTIPDPVGTTGSYASVETYLGGAQSNFVCASDHNLSADDMVVMTSGTGDYLGSGDPQKVFEIVNIKEFVLETAFVATTSGTFSERVSNGYLLKTGTNSTALASLDNIDNFPKNRYNAVALFGARKVILTQLTNLMDSLSVVANQYPGDVVNFSIPNAPSIGTVTALADQTTTIEMFVSPNQITLPGLPDIASDFNIDISNFTAPQFQQVPAPVAPNFDNSTANLGDITAPVYTQPVLGAIDYAKITSYIQDTEDIELAQAQLQEGQAKVAEFQGNVQNQNIAYNAQVEEYKTLVQEELQKIQQLNKVEVDEYTQNLSKYQGDVANETQTFNAKLTKFNQEVQNHITSISTDHKINLDQYSAEVAALMGKAQNDMNAENQRLQASIGKFNALVAQVGQDNKDVISKFNAEIQDYQSQSQAKLGKYNADVQKHTAEVQKITAKYQNIVAEYQAKTGMLDQIRLEYNQIFGVLPQDSKTPQEQRSK